MCINQDPSRKWITSEMFKKGTIKMETARDCNITMGVKQFEGAREWSNSWNLEEGSPVERAASV